MEQLSRREIMGALAVASLSPASLARARTTAKQDLSFVHSELRSAIATLSKQTAGFPEMTRKTLPTMRKMLAGMNPPPAASPPVSKQAIKSRDGAPEVAAYVINAQPGQRKPAILHTHGGGFIMGDAASNVSALQPLAAALDCVVVTVDYRLAPETTFQGSIEDNYAALKWVHDGAEHLGVDPARIAVMGESAGGGHAALLAIKARDRGEVPVAFQCLVYPMLDDRTGTTLHPAPPIGSLLWTEPYNRLGWEWFLGQAPGTAAVPDGAVPARQRNLKGLPPAFIGVGSIDLFVDEDISYARRLIDAGIAAELVVVPGAFHGFDAVAPDTAVVRRFTEVKLQSLRRAFATTS